ncbi:MAG: NUDIX domain-containing protein [Paracoccaceae bacterium]
MIYGDICLPGFFADAAFRAAVLGDVYEAQTLDLEGFKANCPADSPFAQLSPAKDATAGVIILRALPEIARKRLDFAHAIFGGAAISAAFPMGQMIHYTGQSGPDEPLFAQEALQSDTLRIYARALQELMHYFARPSLRFAELAQRFPVICARAASQLRAQAPRPRTISTAHSREDIIVKDQRLPYSNFFAVEESDLSFKTYGGAQSAVITRAGFLQCDAVTVLPFDPVRDCVLLVEQFRFGPFIRGDANPWSLEPIAGRVDPGEGPEEAAHREASEEAQLSLKSLHKIAQYYPSPGAVSEYLYSYLAIADLPDDIEGIAGLASEAEDIRSLRLPFAALMALIESGEINNGPLIMSAQWLAANRARLRRV